MTNESNLAIFEEITKNCSQKIIQKYSKKLEKKLSFHSSKDSVLLRDLTYLLYIYDYIDYVEKIIKMTHNNTQNIKPNDGWVWPDIHSIWGLEIRILRKKNETEQINQIIKEIDNWFKHPLKTEEQENKRRKRILWEEITYSKTLNIRIEKGKTNDANEVRLLALSELIGLTETGLYPDLNDNKEKIEAIIDEYKETIIKTSK